MGLEVDLLVGLVVDFVVVLAGCSFTAANVAQKIICPSLDFWSLFLIRSLTQMIVMGPIGK